MHKRQFFHVSLCEYLYRMAIKVGFIKKIFAKYKEVILYLIFGVLTTVVNYIVYFISKAVGIDYKAATIIAWIAAVVFAYVTNKIWVFESKADGGKALSKEITLFVGARLFSLGLELLIMYVAMDMLKAGDFTVVLMQKTLPMGELIAKTVAQAVIIVSNFIFSKLLIFKNKS